MGLSRVLHRQHYPHPTLPLKGGLNDRSCWALRALRSPRKWRCCLLAAA